MTDNEPKWDYTTKEGNFAAGAAVVGGNLLVYILETSNAKSKRSS